LESPDQNLSPAAKFTSAVLSSLHTTHPPGKKRSVEIASRRSDFFHAHLQSRKQKPLLLYFITPTTHSARQRDRDFCLLCFHFLHAERACVRAVVRAWELDTAAPPGRPLTRHLRRKAQDAQDPSAFLPSPTLFHLDTQTRHARRFARTRLHPGLFDAAEHLTGICPPLFDFLQRSNRLAQARSERGPWLAQSKKGAKTANPRVPATRAPGDRRLPCLQTCLPRARERLDRGIPARKSLRTARPIP
jgi:hypothetical protein